MSGPLALIPAWLILSYMHGSSAYGPALSLSIFVIVWAADVGAYLVGRTIGRVKLAPEISPGKTWEGAIGGLIAATIAAALVATLLGLPLAVFVGVAAAATMLSVVGDLTVSMFKRYVGVKDSGRLLPGHGGILDRIDSLCAAVPLLYAGLWITGV